jgi:hypothetical protein
MPLQNRVAPNGELLAVPARGTFMGNRGGVIHDHQREIVRQYAGRRWLICVLEFKGRRRTVMSPARYTELFFLDEAVALAAGHRPCAECRRERFNAFKKAWLRSANPHPTDFLSVDAIDRELHTARIDRQKGKVIWHAPLKSLPDGAFVQIAGAAYLVRGASLLRWSPSGYVTKHDRSDDLTVAVLTPQPIVRCLSQGYIPEMHTSSFDL